MFLSLIKKNKNYFISTVSKLISIFYGLSLLKILSSFMNEFDFSNYFISYNFVLYFSTLFFTLQGSAVLRFYHILGENNINKFYGILNTISVISLAFLFINSIIFTTLKIDFLIIIFFLIIFYSLFMNEINFLRIKHLFDKVLQLIFIQFFSSITLLLIFRNDLNLKVSLLIISFSFFISFIFIRYNTISSIFNKVSFNYLSKHFQIFKYSFPILLIALFNFMISSFDQYLLKYFGYNDDLAAYIANYNIAEKSIVTLLSIITLVFVPKVFRKYKNLEKETFKDVFNIVFVFIFLSTIILFVLFFYHEIFTIILTNKIYVYLSWIIPYIGFAGIFLGINSLFSEILTVSKKTYKILISYTIGVFINIVLNIIFIDKYGIISALFSSIISYIAMTIVTLYFVYKEYKLLNFIK